MVLTVRLYKPGYVISQSEEAVNGEGVRAGNRRRAQDIVEPGIVETQTLEELLWW